MHAVACSAMTNMHMGAPKCWILSGCGERDVAESLSQTLAPWATPSGWYPEARSDSRCPPLGCKRVTHLGNNVFYNCDVASLL